MVAVTDLTLAAVGDAIINKRVSEYDDRRLELLIEEIENAEVSFVNLETLLHDYEGYPSGVGPGTYMRSPPFIADELAEVGFNLFAAANNHTGDYSHGGMEATMRELEARDLAYAGLGRTLADARAPTYIDTTAGRVALVAACSTFPAGVEAGEQRVDMHGRPGLAPVRLQTRYRVDDEMFDQVKALSEHLDLEGVKVHYQDILGKEFDDDGFELINAAGNNLVFESGSDHGVHQHAVKSDVTATLSQVQEANRQADWVIASLHTHEGVKGYRNDQSVPKFLEEFAHECIDAGADAFMGHGAHVIRGIEIYKSSPIFYGLGTFFLQNESVTRLPAEIYNRYGLESRSTPGDVFDTRKANGFLDQRMFWESILPVCTFDGDALNKIEIYPVDLGRCAHRAKRGIPLLATNEQADAILEELADLSREFNTDVEIEDEKGIIRT